MESKVSRKPIFTRPGFAFLAWCLIFGLAYAQSPLFTSNQNQYFIFGMAKSGLGFLSNDWLLTSTDIAPLFSGLVFATKRIFRWDFVFYLEYFIIFGVYLYSLYAICARLFPKIKDPTPRLLFALGLVLFHSAAFRYLLSKFLSPDWEFLFEGGVAGQRLLGDVFQPSTFGVFLLFAIALFLQKKVWGAILSTAFAALMHPTYLLSAAILTAVFLFIHWRETGSLKQVVLPGLAALILVSPIVIYVAANFLDVDPVMNTAGQQIVIQYRQPHHMLIANWLDLRVMVKFLIFLATAWIVRKQTILWILLIPGFLVISLTGLQALVQSASLAMLFPWRFSVVLVPLSTAILTAYGIQSLNPSIIGDTPLKHRIQLLAKLALVVLALLGVLKFILAANQKYKNPEYAMYEQVKRNQAEDQIYLIPLKMQDFRLRTGIPIVVEYKAAPQSSAGVLEWFERVQEVDHFYSAIPWGEACKRLPDLVLRYGVTHIVLPIQEYKKEDCLFEIWHNTEWGIFIPVLDSSH